MNLFRRLFSVLVLLLLLSPVASAQQRSESEAATIAADFLQRETGTSTPPRLTLLPRQLLATRIRRQLQRPFSGYAVRTGFYVFNADDGGFVIVGADSRQRDVLAYCTEGSFDATDMPCGLTALLEQYNREYESLGNSSSVLKAPSLAPAHIQTQSVRPLIKTEWDQLVPYNNYCPTDPSNNKRCYTGCVATAMAQVMYYFRYPSSPADSVVSYVSDYDDNRKISLTKRLSTIPLNWSNMLQVYKNVSYTNAQGNAVANLMYAAGLSVQMSYSSQASSAFCPDEAYALSHFFGYNDNVQYLRQKYFTSEAWIRLIEEELKAGRPVLYSGHSEPDDDGKSSGHAFVVDGMDSEGRCHVNWGWSGKYQKTDTGANIYYALSSFKPGSSDYTQDHEMVIGIDKTTTGNHEMIFYTESFNINGWEQGFNVGATASFTCNPYCYDSHANTYHTPVWCYLAYGVVDVDSDGKLSLLSNWQEQAIPFLVWQGYKLNRDVTFDASHFQEGHTYKIYPAIINAQKSKWYGVRTKNGASNYYVARVKGGRVYLGKMKAPTLPGEDEPNISCVSQTCDNTNLSNVKPGNRLVLHAVFKNTGAGVTTETRVRIFDSELRGVAYTQGQSHTFNANVQTTVDGSITLPSDIADGNYYATIQYHRTWGDDPTWIYFKDKLIAFTVSTSSTQKEMTVKTSSAGYATFYDSESSYVLPSGLTAYVVTTASGGSLTYKNIAEGSQSGIVPKGVAVMFKGTASKTYKLTATTASASYTGANLLRGSDTSTTTTAPSSSGYLYYKLSFGRSGTAYENAFGWYWGTSYGGPFFIDGHKAWLPLKESSTRAAFLSLDNLEDGIEAPSPNSSEQEEAGIAYDLGGRRVNNGQVRHGVYVMDGKKVFVK